jgi:hypothetical protein
LFVLFGSRIAPAVPKLEACVFECDTADPVLELLEPDRPELRLLEDAELPDE